MTDKKTPAGGQPAGNTTGQIVELDTPSVHLNGDSGKLADLPLDDIMAEGDLSDPGQTPTPNGAGPKTHTAGPSSPHPDIMPELPQSARLPDSMGAGACRWLDEYERFSRLWSPRGWDDFHAAAGLWILSTIAGRRVMLPFGGQRFTNLYFGLTATTTVYGKTTTSKIAGDTIRAAGLDHLLIHGDSTPQAFVQTLATNGADLKPDATPETIEKTKRRLLFAGQRGWMFEEFGGKVAAMMRDGSVMSEYRALMLRFDDCDPTYEYRTISRGSETIQNPYLALLANVTPAYLQPFAGRGAPLWADGFFARFVFLTPPENEPRKRGRFPDNDRVIPAAIADPLQEWHKRLGEPHIAQQEIYKLDKEGLPGAVEKIRLYNDSDRHPTNVCRLGGGVVDAFYNYNEALLDLAIGNDDLIGSYGRMAEKALRVAMLFASLENDGLIEMRHWAKAQNIAERWRQNLHNLYAQLTGQVTQTANRTMQDAIIRQLSAASVEGRGMTKRELVQKIWGLDVGAATDILAAMMGAGLVEERKNGKRTEFWPSSADI